MTDLDFISRIAANKFTGRRVGGLDVVVAVDPADFFKDVGVNEDVPAAVWHSYRVFVAIYCNREVQLAQDLDDFVHGQVSAQDLVGPGSSGRNNNCFLVPVAGLDFTS